MRFHSNMINGQVFRDMVLSGANAIDNEKEKINSLNVFPVPDGDTGINMSLTMNAAAAEPERKLRLLISMFILSFSLARNYIKS